ncbi:MAG: hypothetical protein MPI95_05515 [Nitrosopumilus sp.]|nr:hypothetical protein [Nitrosopumilus sp.]CAI9831475.1 hypothetical protein IBTHAUMO2_250020 [Nitrosopumilaceae archaeon]MDA7945465.1 hypothetical protein [Nitrosopumilus sp.]MDA7953494.1 hypothetical protein [Nitrosopumilus sp.]MDA7958528.1 hypothetical protein [Nitrosopumilus sp.]
MAAYIDAGLDVSYMQPGHKSHARFEYVAYVLGDRDRLNSIANRYGLDGSVHMRRLGAGRRDRILSGMDLSGAGVSACCIKITRMSTINEVRVNTSYTHSRVAKSFDLFLFREIASRMEEFIRPYKLELRDVEFQSDADCDSMLDANRIKHVRPKKAHNLADAVAWANSHGTPITGVSEVDLADKILAKMMGG